MSHLREDVQDFGVKSIQKSKTNLETTRKKNVSAVNDDERFLWRVVQDRLTDRQTDRRTDGRTSSTCNGTYRMVLVHTDRLTSVRRLVIEILNELLNDNEGFFSVEGHT